MALTYIVMFIAEALLASLAAPPDSDLPGP
jgi:hypothetical protein